MQQEAEMEKWRIVEETSLGEPDRGNRWQWRGVLAETRLMWLCENFSYVNRGPAFDTALRCYGQGIVVSNADHHTPYTKGSVQNNVACLRDRGLSGLDIIGPKMRKPTLAVQLFPLPVYPASPGT